MPLKPTLSGECECVCVWGGGEGGGREVGRVHICKLHCFYMKSLNKIVALIFFVFCLLCCQ